MTSIVVVIIIVLVTALAYVTAAVSGHVVAVAAVVTGIIPPAALIVVLPIVGPTLTPAPPTPPTPIQCRALHRERQCNPVGSQSAAGRRRWCGDSSRHHRRLRHNCSGWYCSSFCRCCDGRQQCQTTTGTPPRHPQLLPWPPPQLSPCCSPPLTAAPPLLPLSSLPFFCFLIVDC